MGPQNKHVNEEPAHYTKHKCFKKSGFVKTNKKKSYTLCGKEDLSQKI